MTVCFKCGAAIAANASFCGQCGAPLRDPEATQPVIPGLNIKRDNSGVDRSTSTYNIQQTINQGAASAKVKCDLCGAFQDRENCFECKRCGRMACKRHMDVRTLVCAECAQIVGEDGVMSARPNRGSRISARIWTEAAAPATRDIHAKPVERDVYRIGEKFTIYAQADRDCFLSLVNLGTSGALTLLLKNMAIAGGRVLALSGPDASQEWFVAGPAGVERLKAYFTLEPVSIFPGYDNFADLGVGKRVRDIVSRIKEATLMIDRLPPDAWTESACEFVVEEMSYK